MTISDGVHQTHCCARHGCVYGEPDCPVYMSRIKQDFPCEDCRPPQDVEAQIRELKRELAWSRKVFGS